MSADVGRYRKYPVMEPPVWRETKNDAAARRQRNHTARMVWEVFINDRCAACGNVRFHVSHEMDPENSAEGPEYHAGFGHHPFRATPDSTGAREA